MPPRPVLPLLAVLAATLLLARPSGVPASPPASEANPVVDSARAELAAGRHWHAARLLAPLADSGVLKPDERVLLARSRAGYRDWPGVVRVLDGVAWLDEVEGGAGWWLLGRAREALGDDAGAADAYARLDQRGWSEDGVPSAAVTARLARSRWALGDTAGALRALDDLAAQAVLRSWTAEGFAEAAVAAGRRARVEELVARVDDPGVRARLWDAPERARLAAGDTAGAASGYAAALARAGTSEARRARVARVSADARRLAGNPVEAVEGYRAALREAPLGSADGAAAARWLVELDGVRGADEARLAGRHLDRAGDGRRALAAWDLYVDEVRTSGGEPDPALRVERARLMATLPDRQEEAIREWRSLSTHPSADVGTRSLALWTDLRRSQGRTGDVATLRGWLVERYPATAEAAQVVFLRADAAQDRQRWGEALEGYEAVARMAPEVDYAGLARMRAGQIHLHRGEVDAALRVFRSYLDDFPRGRRWEEAAYWAARAHGELGDTAAAMELLGRLRAEEPFSYYSVLTAELLGEPYAVELPPGPSDPALPWVDEGLAVLDLLTAAGAPEPAGRWVEGLVDRAGEEGVPALLALAEGLNARARSLTGINLGWEARRRGEPWSQRLVRIVYPFPYMELVRREAEEVGVDPLLLAALIRQESAFVPNIVSSAGAVGLMQVMPTTGRALARRLGVENFTPETLESPEVNLHLGARFLVEQLQTYGPELPLVLSAYNAGPARADRWRTLPEAGDLLRFTERIPFSETRGYVKNVTRNRSLYGALYGDQLGVVGR